MWSTARTTGPAPGQRTTDGPTTGNENETVDDASGQAGTERSGSDGPRGPESPGDWRRALQLRDSHRGLQPRGQQWGLRPRG